MFDFKGFRKANKLTQEEVGRYLGVGKTFICNVEKGLSKLPKVHLESLLNNDRGWDVSLITEQQQNLVNFEFTEQTDSPIVTSQVLEEMTASRQLAEQALAMVQEQLEAKQQTILAVREQLATTQEQLTTEQRQTNAEKETTRALLEDIKMGRQQLQAVIDRESRQQDEFFMLLRKQEARFVQEIERMEARIDKLMHHHKEHHKDSEHEHHHPHKHSNNNDA